MSDDVRRDQEELTYHHRLLHAITSSVAEVVIDPSLPHAMAHALREVGEVLGVDRVLLLPGMHAGEAPLTQETTFAWERDGSIPPLYSSSPTPEESRAVTAWLAPLLTGEPVSAYASTATGFVAEFMRVMGTLSILIVPIEVGGAFWGRLAFDNCTSPRTWTSLELDAVGIFARVVGAVLLREQTLADLRRSEEQFRIVSDTVEDAIIMISSDGRIGYWNRAAERILGYSAAEVQGRVIHEFLAPPRFRSKADAGLANFAQTGQGPIIGKTVELAATRKDGVEIPIEVTVNPMVLGSGRHAVALLRDITERNNERTLIDRFARYDELTDLPNRRLFSEGLELAIVRAERTNEGFAVLYLDLDRFKDVNDTLGHPTGDRLLQGVAERLHGNVRASDTVGRFGGDEFAAIAANIHESADAAKLADKLVRTIALPFDIDGQQIHTSTSIGIAVYGPESPDAESLLAHADVALYRAKADGRGRYRFYTGSMDSDVRSRVSIEAELGVAIAEGQFFIEYQPQVDVKSRRIVGLEALVRWQHPVRGILGPTQFIAAAEASGQIIGIGRLALQMACARMKQWIDLGIAPPLISINLSGVQFQVPAELENDIADVVAAHGIPASMLELELTESVLMDALRENGESLQRLRALGLRISIDDFGTGYSSLDYLRRFHVDRIKIPGTFIVGLLPDSSGASIVRATIGLARELGIDVIVEGVENAEQVGLLYIWGCSTIQGDFFSRPLADGDVTPLLRAGLVA